MKGRYIYPPLLSLLLRVGQCIAKHPEGFSKLRLKQSFGTTQKQRSVDFDNGED